MTKMEYLWLLIQASQNKQLPACDEHGRGLYLTSEGKRCPAGLLIVEGYYNSVIERRAVSDPELDCRMVLPDDVGLDQLILIQACHDELAFRGWDHYYWVSRVATILARPDNE